MGHSNRWESREIARIFTRLGYVVDGISFKDSLFVPSMPYDVVFDISTNLQRLAPLMGSRTLKILHRTGSDAFYQNRAEMTRVKALEARRGMLYSPRKMVAYPDLERKSLEIADRCSLFGNQHTLETYPEEFRRKLTLLPVSGSELGGMTKRREDLVPPRREFLSFCGGGMVHKGLDLLLEVFAMNPQYTLNVVGNAQEADFHRIYEKELRTLPNIRCYGFLKPGSREFKKILRDTFCFLSPSCSEGMSSAVVTCMQAGLYPIISRDSGVTLPEGCGTMLETCSLEEITGSVEQVHQLDAKCLTRQTAMVQNYAWQTFTRERFRDSMCRFIMDALDGHSGSLP
jgi:glycosyltransferase involved in cell wall biosynthesis